MSNSARRKAPHHMTADEFLAWAGDDRRHGWQLVDGEPHAMAPGSVTHGIIQANLAYLLTRHLRESGSPCFVVTEPAIVPRVRAQSNVRVPDVVVTCSPNEQGQQVLADPLLVIEILSPTNEADTWRNVWAYTSIPSVREILIIRSTRIAVELLRRNTDSSWPAESTQLIATDQLRFDSIGLTCPLTDLYARTHLTSAVAP